MDIVTGALAYKEKTVRSVMTPLNDAYLLSIKTVLDFETISEIRDQVPCGFPENRQASKKNHFYTTSYTYFIINETSSTA